MRREDERRGEEEDGEGTMTDGHWRRGEEEGIRAGVGGHWHRFKALATSEWRYSTSAESWGCEKRCDVDLGSSYDGGWRQSHYRCLIGPDEGVYCASFFFSSFGQCRSKKTGEIQFITTFYELHPTWEIIKRCKCIIVMM